MNKHCPHCGGKIGLFRKLFSLEGYYSKECPHCKKRIKLKKLNLLSTLICVAMALGIIFSDVSWVRIASAIGLVVFLIVASALLPIISGEDDK